MKYKDIIKATSYQINSSDIFLWQCFGNNCRIYDLILSTNNENLILDEYSEPNYIGSFVADNNGKIYASYFYDEKNNIASRWVDPEYLVQYKKEYSLKNLNFSYFLETVLFTDIFNEKDYLTILSTYYQNNKLDIHLSKNENISVNLDDNTFLFIAKLAHEKNITFNEMSNELLSSQLLKLIDNKTITINNK
jgi:hypothetical protein